MKILVIANQTVRSYIRDRVLHSVLLFSVLFVLFAFFLSTLTVVESRKILLDFGFSAISIMGVVLGLFMGVTVVGREIEKRTIYTVLSKPVGRTEYLVGKFLGSAIITLLVHALNALTLVVILYELGEGLPAGFFTTNYLMALESLLVMALALFFSLSLSSLFLAGSLTVAFFLVGRSSQSLHIISQKTGGLAKILLRILYDFFPSLDRFNIRELVAYGKPYPEGMATVSTLYFFAYLLFLLALSAHLIRRKDFT